MPLEGLRWSRDSGSALYDTPQTAVLGRAGGGQNSFRPHSTFIDFTRPSLITIGSNCYFNENFVILTHDWVTKVFLNSGLEFLTSS